MNQEIKAKWVEALRSGEYPQGRQYLNQNGNFCCLGVLTDLYIKEHNKEWTQEEGGTPGVKNAGFHTAILPESVIKWSDMTDEVGAIGLSIIPPKDGQGFGLAHCNDGLKLTFDQIADVIQYAF